jgi:hypothetical protein
VFDDESEDDAVFEAEPDAHEAAEMRRKGYLAWQRDHELREQGLAVERLEDEKERVRTKAEAEKENERNAPNTPSTLASKLSNLTLGTDSGASTLGSDGSLDFGQMSRAFKQMRSQQWKSSRKQASISSTISRDNTCGESARRAELFAEFGRRRGFCDRITNLAETTGDLMDSQDYFGMASPVLKFDHAPTFWSPFRTRAQSPAAETDMRHLVSFDENPASLSLERINSGNTGSIGITGTPPGYEDMRRSVLMGMKTTLNMEIPSTPVGRKRGRGGKAAAGRVITSEAL